VRITESVGELSLGNYRIASVILRAGKLFPALLGMRLPMTRRSAPLRLWVSLGTQDAQSSEMEKYTSGSFGCLVLQEIAIMRVLVADHNRDGADSLAAVLRHWSHEVEVVYDHESVLGTTRDFQPQIMFLDIGILNPKGGELALALRRESQFRQLVIIAMSPFAADDKRVARHFEYFDAYISKPFDLDLLDRAFSEASQSSGRSEA